MEEFVPYELAVKLKELGFDEPCFGYYDEGGNLYTEMQEYLLAPLYQQAFRWFREKYKLNGRLNHYPNTKLWDFSIHNLLWNGKEFVENVRKEDRSLRYSTYEEAETACLAKLIEIVEQKEK